MVKKTIEQLDDGELIRTSNAVVAFQEGGITKKCSIRPNPLNVHYIRNQAQLEAALGTNLNLPNGESTTIVIDESFTLTKPFLADGPINLQIVSTNKSKTLTYTGGGALIRKTVPSSPVFSILIDNTTIDGTGGTLVDVKDIVDVIITNCELIGFDSLGVTTNTRLVNLSRNKFTSCIDGLRVVDSEYIIQKDNTITITVDNKFTFLTISARNTPCYCYMDNNHATGFFADDSLVFFDPIGIAGTTYTIEHSSVDAGNFYHPGSARSIIDVLNASGKARFRTGSSHSYTVGDVISLSGFTEPSYNLTGIVTDTPTGVEFMVDDLNFVSSDTGDATSKSADQESFIVTAADNPNQSNSLSITEARGLHTGVRSGLTVTINGGDNTQFDVAAGEAIIVNYDDPLNPTFQRILFAGQTAIPGAPASHVTFIYLNSGGTLDVTEDIPTKADVKGRPFVGQLIQSEATGEIFFSLQNPIVAHSTSLTEINDLVIGNGAKRVSGCDITPASTDLSIDIAAGEVKQYGRNFGTDPHNPNFRTTPATIPVPANLLFKATTNPVDGLILITPAVLTDQLDPTKYNAGGLLTGPETDGLTNVPPNNFTVIRLFLSANSNALIPYYGTALYSSAQDALTAAEPTWMESPETFSTSPIAKIAIKNTVTDLAAGIAAGDVIIMAISERIQL